MKKISLFMIFLTITVSLSAIDYTTVKSGDWSDNSTWDIPPHPNISTDNVSLDNNDSIAINATDITINILTFKNNSILYVAPGYTLTVDSISILNNAMLYIDGSLIVTNGVSMANNSALDIDLGGNIDIGGSLEAGNGVDLSIDGTMDIAGDITMGNGSTVEGDGDIYVEGDVDIPNGSDPGTVINDPLPIELIYFIIEQNVLRWATASEMNNDYFTIEKSYDLIDWSIVTTIPGAGNSNIIINYKYEVCNEKAYYRLKQTDYDGVFEYSRIIYNLETTMKKPSIDYYGGKLIIHNQKTPYALTLSTITGNLIQKDIITDPMYERYLIPGYYVIKIDKEAFKIYCNL